MYYKAWGVSSEPGASSARSSSLAETSISAVVGLTIIANTTAASNQPFTSAYNLSTAQSLAVTLANSNVSSNSPASVMEGTRSRTGIASLHGFSNSTSLQPTVTAVHNGTQASTNSSGGTAFSSTPYLNSSTISRSTQYLNTSIAPTGTGSLYASQCNALWDAWSTSSIIAPNIIATELTGTYTFTKWAASTTVLGGCDSSVRLVGSFTPTATAIGSSLGQWTVITRSDFAQPTPACSVSPSDCENLYQQSVSSLSAFQAGVTAAQTTVSLALYAAALTVGNETTTYGTGSMATPPTITLNSKSKICLLPLMHSRTWSSQGTFCQVGPCC